MASIAQPPPLPPDVTSQMGVAEKPPFAAVGGMLADKIGESDKNKVNPVGDIETSIDAVKRILTNISTQHDAAAPYVKRMTAIADQMMAEIKAAGAPGTNPKTAGASKAEPASNPKLQGNVGTPFPG